MSLKMNVFSHFYERGAEILFTEFQTHRIRFCGKNFDTFDNSQVMPLDKRPPTGGLSEGVQSPGIREVVLGTVPDFIDFHIHPRTFLWQMLRGLSGRGCPTLSFITMQW